MDDTFIWRNSFRYITSIAIDCPMSNLFTNAAASISIAFAFPIQIHSDHSGEIVNFRTQIMAWFSITNDSDGPSEITSDFFKIFLTHG